MNVLFLSLLYYPDDAEKVIKRSRDALQNQINNYQWAFVNGLRQNLAAGESLSVLNSLPVGIYPTRYRSIRLPGVRRSDTFTEIGCINLPGIKQWQRARHARRELERWVRASSDNRTVLLYSLYLPYMRAIAAVKRNHPTLQAVVIVTDLPNELGISSGRTGILKTVEYAMGKRRLDLCDTFDGFVLLTAPMAVPLRVGIRPSIVIEGLISEEICPSEPIALPEDTRPAVLYTGTLNREFGIAELLEAFRDMGEAQLWLCGRGDMEEEIAQASRDYKNIRYFGFVPQHTALAWQAKADALINPRTSRGVFTRYSFPSKTLEYMRSGKPVLCCKLEGIPDEYDACLRYIDPQTVQGIRDAVRALLALPIAERERIGSAARDFALTQKNSEAQCAKLMRFLRELQR